LLAHVLSFAPLIIEFWAGSLHGFRGLEAISECVPASDVILGWWQDPSDCFGSEPEVAWSRGSAKSRGLTYVNVSMLTLCRQSDQWMSIFALLAWVFNFSCSANFAFSTELLYYAQWCYCITHNGVTVLRTMVLLYYAQWWSDSESAFPFIVTQHKEVMPNGRFLSKGAECPGW